MIKFAVREGVGAILCRANSGDRDVKTEAFGIFEGGGAKGLAHAGALKAAEERFEFIGVAGTSAGAIVASLIAAGYKADEIYSPESPDSIFNTNLTELLVPSEWAQLKPVRDRLRRRTSGDGEHRTAKRASAVLLVLSVLLAVAALLFFVTGLYSPFVASIVIAGMGFCVCLVLRYFRRIRTTTNMCLNLALGWFIVHWRAVRHCKVLWAIGTRGGVLDTTLFRDWLNDKLAEKLAEINKDFSPGGRRETVNFADLPIGLKIIAADSGAKAIRVFAAPLDGSVGVADAVAASISIPFIFVPKPLEGRTYVDGGIMSNFPAWVFDKERKTAPRLTPTIGFRFVATEDETEIDASSFSIGNHIKDVSYSAFFGDNSLETRNVATLKELVLRVKIGVLDFDVNEEAKEAVYDAAFRSAQLGLEGIAYRVSDQKMGQILSMVDNAIRSELQHKGHMRVSIMLPIDNSTLQVVYGYNMDGEQDTDDQLILAKGQGASGLCWRQLQPIICDLEDAKETYADVWQMDKYQQRMVRTTLKSLLSVPLFESGAATLEEGFLGVLNFDSDDNLLQQFDELVKRGSDGYLESCAMMVAERLTNWRLL